MNTSISDNLDAVTTSTGVVVSAVRSGSALGCTLSGSTTYYFVVGGSEAPTPSEVPLVAIHLKWAAAVAAVFTVETCNFPKTIGGNGHGPADILDYSATAGDWILENPSTAIVAVTGSGNSSTAATVTAGGSAAGGCMFHMGNLGSRRARIKAVVTTGGLVRCGVRGKE